MATRRTKAVCRNLPPDLPESAFVRALAAEGFAGRYGYLDYARGAWKQRLPVPSVAWIQFADEQALFDFRGAFGGRIFRAGERDDVEERAGGESATENAEGDGEPAPEEGAPAATKNTAVPEGMEEWRARVEYAPNQKTPRGKQHRDKREGTIGKDAAYLQFVKDLEASMEAPPAPTMTAEQALERREAAERAATGKSDFKVSALLRYVMEQKKKEMDHRKAAKAAAKAAKGGKKAAGAGAKDAKPSRRDANKRKKGTAGAQTQPAPKTLPSPKPAPSGASDGNKSKQDGGGKKHPPEPAQQRKPTAPPPEPKQGKVKVLKQKAPSKPNKPPAPDGGGGAKTADAAGAGGRGGGAGAAGGRGGGRGGRGGRGGGGKSKPKSNVQVFRSDG